MAASSGFSRPCSSIGLEYVSFDVAVWHYGIIWRLNIFQPPAHFSENWGLASLFPLIFANIFSVAFGMNLDAHAPAKDAPAPVVPDASSSDQCLQGRECYVDSLRLTAAACFLSLLISIWAGWRDYRKLAASTLKEPRPREVVWEGVDDD